MLRTQIFKCFGLLILILGLVAALVGVRIVRTQIIKRAEDQVRSDLNSAWGVLQTEMDRLEMVLRFTSNKESLAKVVNEGKWDDKEFRSTLENVRLSFGLDFLSIMAPNGKVVLRSAAPYTTGDYYVAEPAIKGALEGKHSTTITLMDAEALDRENQNLSEREFIVLEKTPKARPTEKTTESRGMVMFSAVPVSAGNGINAVLYGGILLNRNEKLTELIQKNVFDSRRENASNGAVTIFLKDCRIATTVTMNNGDLALGTRVSKDVADRVLDNGKPWQGRAFVVKDWHLSAYDPIKDLAGRVIGMLYVGIPEAPFRAMVKDVLIKYTLLSLGGVIVALLMAFLLAARIARPLHYLADAAHQMRGGKHPGKVTVGNASAEALMLIDAFNAMTDDLTEREARLRSVNEELTVTNKSYMETLGFISHELKTPLGSILNYSYLLGEKRLGDLNERQLAAIKNIDNNTRRITEMVRLYLNLSRVENKELHPHTAVLDIKQDILEPLLGSFDAALNERNIKVENEIEDGLLCAADLNMAAEIFENLIGNAIKYGNDNGIITLKASRKENMIEFVVRNTGQGIPAEYREMIFEKFTRLENRPLGKQAKGTGLGLFITRHLINAHGGTIRVESREGEWTEFVFTLPNGEKERVESYA